MTSVRFKGRVVEVTLLSKFAGTVKPVHSDPRYVMVVEVSAVDPAALGIASGGTEAFAIHSPARLFRDTRGEAAVGRSFGFAVDRTTAAAGVRWSRLRLDSSP